MMTIGHLAKFLLSLEPNKDPARLALYHYVLHQGDLASPLKSQLISDFVEFALLHEHWQNNRGLLQSELEVVLQRFAETYRVRFDWENILWPAENQIVRIEDPKQTRLLVQQLNSNQPEGSDQFKILQNREGHITTIAFFKSGGLSVKVYPHLARLYQGQLLPLPSQKLYYDQQLGFEANRTQIVQTDKHSYAVFKFSNLGCEGRLLRGYTFQKSMVFDGGGLNRYPLVFYPVKRLEQFFIHRKTDPMYVELVQNLEKSIHLIREGHPEAFQFASASFERGRLAFHEIFPDDKLVGILLNSLEVLINPSRTAPQAEPVL